MRQHSLRLAALIWAMACSSIVEARETRPIAATPVIETRAEIRSTETGFEIYTMPVSPDMLPAPVAVSVGSSVRMDKAILMQPKLPVRNAGQ